MFVLIKNRPDKLDIQAIHPKSQTSQKRAPLTGANFLRIFVFLAFYSPLVISFSSAYPFDTSRLSFDQFICQLVLFPHYNTKPTPIGAYS